MSDFETESRLLEAEAELSGPPAAVEKAAPPARTVEMVTLEIRTLQRQAQQVVLGYAIEIGRRLEEVKEMIPHGHWGEYLKNEVEYSQSTAQNFMRIYREYGASQQSLFGGQANSQAFGNLTYTKALQLLALPDAEERERFVAEHDVENMSTRELSEALKARDAALAEAAEAKAVADGLRLDAEHLQADLDEQKRVYEKSITSATTDIELAKQKANQWQEACENAREDATAARKAAAAASAEHTRLLQELEELRNRPVDVAVEVDTEAVEAARKSAIEEMTGKVDAAKDAKKRAEAKSKEAEAALSAVQKELEALKAKEPEVRELSREEKDALTADAVEKAKAESAEQIRSLEKKLTIADGDTSAFKVHFDTWQESYKKMMDYLKRINSRDQEKAGKLRDAVKAGLERMAVS